MEENEKKQIQALEQEVLSQTNNILQIVRRIQEIEVEMCDIVKKCAVDIAVTQTLYPLYKGLLEQGDIEQKKYIELRKLKEDTVRKLRESYKNAITNNHMSRKQQSAATGQTTIRQVDLAKSQLLSGTLLDEEPSPDDITQLLQRSLWIPDSEILVIGGRHLHRKKRILLGTSENAQVFQGTCRGMEVAVKVLLKQNTIDIEQFRKECQVLRNTASHPHLLLFIGACLEAGKHKIVLEWARNGSLEALVSGDLRNLHFRKKISILSEICDGMCWLHKSKLLHLNLKPSNILFTTSWKVKIADYGLAHIHNFSDPKHIENKSVYYTAPELLSTPPKPPSEACDVYSFAILAWYILMEKDPYTIKEMNQFKSFLFEGNRPPVPPNTPAPLKEILDRCWSSFPQERLMFESLCEQSKWNSIIDEAIAPGEQAAKTVWTSLGEKGEMPQQVGWSEFVRAFSIFLHVPNSGSADLESTIEWKCLKAMLEVKKEKITKLNFERFLSWFGPVRTGSTEGVDFLKQITNLLKQEWFHGNISREEAERRLNADSKRKENCFLLRFSVARPTYTISIRKKTETQHKRLNKDDYPNIASLIKYITKEKKKNRWQSCTSSRSNFQSIFQENIISLYNVDPSTTEIPTTKSSSAAAISKKDKI